MPIGKFSRRSAGLRGIFPGVVALALSIVLTACGGGVPARYEMVPARHDHSASRMIVKHMSLVEVARRCSRHLPAVRAQTFGCALGDERLCLVYLPHKTSVGSQTYERLYRHERAHCNGWRH